jgi:hypothetical protein
MQSWTELLKTIPAVPSMLQCERAYLSLAHKSSFWNLRTI